jgi:kynureninase
MKTITAAGHEAGAVVGWDLAHAAGNIKLNYTIGMLILLHGGSYKYMNSGPGMLRMFCA